MNECSERDPVGCRRVNLSKSLVYVHIMYVYLKIRVFWKYHDNVCWPEIEACWYKLPWEQRIRIETTH